MARIERSRARRGRRGGLGGHGRSLAEGGTYIGRDVSPRHASPMDERGRRSRSTVPVDLRVPPSTFVTKTCLGLTRVTAARKTALEPCWGQRSARRNWWEDRPVVSHRLRTSPESLRSARDPRSVALRPSNPVPGTVLRITPLAGLAVRTCPFGRDEMYRPGLPSDNRLIHELHANLPALIPDFPGDVDGMWMSGIATSGQRS
jgi:hypothetical protein